MFEFSGCRPSTELHESHSAALGIIPNPDLSGLDSSTNSLTFVPTCRDSVSESLTTTNASSFIKGDHYEKSKLYEHC